MKTLEILDVCYPDYFSGFHRPVITVPVFNNMLVSELAEGIKQELNSCYDHFTYGDNGFTKTEMLIIDEYVKNLLTHGDDVFIGDEFYYEADSDDICYAHLSICKINYSYGMKFLS